MPIVVTGATGQLGRLVVESLLEKVPAEQIVAAGRNVKKVADLAERGVQVRRIDFDQPETLTAAFAGADKLLLVSSLGPDELRIVQHRAAVQAAKDAGVGLLVYTSITDADTSPLTLARNVHKPTEQAIKESGLRYVLLRNAMYTENWTATLRQAVEQGSIVANAGDGRIVTAARADLAAAAAAVLTGDGHEGKTYELTGTEAWSFADLAAQAAAVSGKPVTYQDVSDETMLSILTGPAGLPQFVAEQFVEIQAAIRAGHLAQKTDDLAMLIGRAPTGLAKAVAAALA
ncbi:quinone oxidoreductase [Carbonactinospora thermoautotrophica]|uniref:Male sterility domain-containing protein n=1 Tax=Carbonactinospora thermoautotrophica TaxID=1469144 RepID=A0A132N3U0_9ACTN|nr:SDR family oxidoreductase [Carbonactinospora thermoautotrophica]KWX01093.1 Male sterility domain-containing protein [Carbonactinospora thermoautotrophica]KWX04754.1 quinone oxidoreductase [Carbonactinospora thermoautotrophica]KWX07924.1 quinone oxidoreductase [Carbonactinospora thermoautotrophica]